MDGETVASIERFSERVRPDQACGCRALNGLARAARDRGMTIHTLDVRNSGDTVGRHDSVVGYASFALCESLDPLFAKPRDESTERIESLGGVLGRLQWEC